MSDADAQAQQIADEAVVLAEDLNARLYGHGPHAILAALAEVLGAVLKHSVRQEPEMEKALQYVTDAARAAWYGGAPSPPS